MKGGVTWRYAKRKHGHEDFDYWHPLVEPVLTETHGLIAYQEQVMEVAKQLGDFSGAEADDMRKAMGKLYRIRGGTAAKDFMRQLRGEVVRRDDQAGHPAAAGGRDLGQAVGIRTLRLQQEPQCLLRAPGLSGHVAEDLLPG